MLQQIKLTNTIKGRSISNEKSVKGQQKKKHNNRQTDKETYLQTEKETQQQTNSGVKFVLVWLFFGPEFLERKKILGFIEVDRVNERCLETFK